MATQPGVKRTTALAIIQSTDKNDSVVARPRGGARQGSAKVSREMIDTAVMLVEQNPEFTLDQLNDEMMSQHPDRSPVRPWQTFSMGN